MCASAQCAPEATGICVLFMTINRTGSRPCLPLALRELRAGRVRPVVAIAAKGLICGILVGSFVPCRADTPGDLSELSALALPWSVREDAATALTIENPPALARAPKRAQFERERASSEARQVADWIVDSGDNQSMPFAIVDKKDAKVFVFAADGRLRGAAAALLGLARGDDAVPGIGDRPLSSIRPAERTTPAGRFVASLGRNAHEKEILWVDYDLAVSMHPVVTSNVKEHRLHRLNTPTPLDNRISFGCINVPAKFFERVVQPAFSGTNGVVYVLPETKLAREVFAVYDVEERARVEVARQPAPAPTASVAARLGG